MKKYYKINEIAKLYNVKADSLRYYEEVGLIHPLFKIELSFIYIE
ncbi:MerR family DNA-binding transcriptional regulator [Holdemanella biformis]|mgnify:FL=1